MFFIRYKFLFNSLKELNKFVGNEMGFMLEIHVALVKRIKWKKNGCKKMENICERAQF